MQGRGFIGRKICKRKRFSLEIIAADWKKYGKRAGPIRNEQMALIGDYIICFWDGKSKGTRSMIDSVEKNGKPL